MKNTHPIEDLRLAVETAKRILTKEKIDRQLAGQSSLTPCMNIKDGYHSKKVTFDMYDRLDDKIDQLTLMMSKLKAQGNHQNRQFKPQIYQSKQRGQLRNYYDQNNYDQSNYQNRCRSNSGDRSTSFRGTGQHGQNYRGGSQYVNNYRNDFRRNNFREIKMIEDKTLEVGIEMIIEMTALEEVGLRKENIQVILAEMIDIIVDQDQVQEPVLTRDRILMF